MPKHCKLVDAPLLKPDIKAAMTDALIKRDKTIETKQGAAISCVGEALSRIFNQNNKDTSVVKLLIEAGRIMCDKQHIDSMSRRSYICSGIKKEIKNHLYETNIDKYVFGERLSDIMKSAKALWLLVSRAPK